MGLIIKILILPEILVCAMLFNGIIKPIFNKFIAGSPMQKILFPLSLPLSLPLLFLSYCSAEENGA
ncbi:hypothetical protein EGM89_07735, partial [Helicobacter pylori]